VGGGGREDVRGGKGRCGEGRGKGGNNYLFYLFVLFICFIYLFYLFILFYLFF
jgi:hypothetical protein